MWIAGTVNSNVSIVRWCSEASATAKHVLPAFMSTSCSLRFLGGFALFPFFSDAVMIVMRSMLVKEAHSAMPYEECI